MHADSLESRGWGRFARTIDMLGLDGFERLRSSFVVVMGLGGVGSHAAVALARSGIGRIRLVDFDTVTESSLNRHAVACPGDVGRDKVELVAARMRAINPDLEVEECRAFFHEETADALLAGPPDYVVDAIDSLTPKVVLLKSCGERGIPVIGCMGASARRDPSLVRVGLLGETQGCPLARMLRKRLRKQGVALDIPVVYSTEPAGAVLPPDDAEERYERGRVRNRLPSLPTLPAMFGNAAAQVVIEALSCG